MDALLKRLEKLEQQNQALQDTVRKLQQAPAPVIQPTLSFATSEQGAGGTREEVRGIVADVLKEREAKKKADEDAAKQKAADDGSVIGNGAGMTAKWNHGLWLESADKAFKFHIGGRTQADVAIVDADQDVLTGTGGIGRFDNAVNFRRARLTAEGTFYEIFNFAAEYDFLNTFDDRSAVPSGTFVDAKTGKLVTIPNSLNPGTVFDTPVPTDLWVEATRLPWIGNLRVGNQKPPISFEHLTSSRFLNFLERSYGFDAFVENGNNGFTQGVQMFNWTENERATWALAYTKNTRGIFGWNIGDGEWGPTGRVTWLPCYEDKGRYLVHLGLAGQYYDLDDDIVRYRARTLIRNGPAVLHNVVALARMHGSSYAQVNPEFVVQMGPFLLQSEYTAVQTYDVTEVTDTPALKKFASKSSSYFSQSAYVEALYFLTGEHRDYDKKYPRFGRVVPYRSAFWAEGDDGHRVFSPGAWQVGVRYSWIDLNDPGAGIFGGEINSLTFGLNWFLNPNFKVQWNYELAHRDIPNGTASGNYQGFGTRFAIDF